MRPKRSVEACRRRNPAGAPKTAPCRQAMLRQEPAPPRARLGVAPVPPILTGRKSIKASPQLSKHRSHFFRINAGGQSDLVHRIRGFSRSSFSHQSMDFSLGPVESRPSRGAVFSAQNNPIADNRTHGLAESIRKRLPAIAPSIRSFRAAPVSCVSGNRNGQGPIVSAMIWAYQRAPSRARR